MEQIGSPRGPGGRAGKESGNDRKNLGLDTMIEYVLPDTRLMVEVQGVYNI